MASFNISEYVTTTEKNYLKAAQDGYLEKWEKMVETKSKIIQLLANSTAKNELHKAIEDLEVVKLFIQLGANVNAKNRYDSTPLQLAAKNGNIDVAKCLIEHGAKLDMKNKIYGRAPIHYAVIYGKIEVAKCLIEHGAKVDMKNEDGEAPLHLAIENGDIEVVKCLIEHGAQVDLRDKNNKTPFDWADQNGHHEIATYLLEKKREASNQKPPSTIDDKAPCIICLEPRNGFFVLNPCGHASLCEPCTYKLVIQNDSKCPNCTHMV